MLAQDLAIGSAGKQTATVGVMKHAGSGKKLPESHPQGGQRQGSVQARPHGPADQPPALYQSLNGIRL